MPVLPANAPKRLAVVGAGPAGLAFAVNAAARGHHVTLFDALPEIGGQFNIAKQIPGKEEFHETLRYYRTMLDLHGVDLRLNTRVTTDDLLAFDETDPRHRYRPAPAGDRRDRSSKSAELS
ncbi:NAD(P)/FAD-dependent oxidoreductase [Klebsiella pneumoniae]|nr:NAD(P)/FAD-dependent oxidoreductase [Klebsiella pneumoniae]